MKKILIRIALVVVVLVVLAVVVVALFLDGAIKKGVETIGPQIAKVEVKLDSVSLSLLSGSGKVKGLILGNPEGYKTPHAISVGLVAMSVSPGSLLSDKIVVKSIRVEAPEIAFELGPGGNNLKRIQANAASASGTNTPAAGATPSKPGKKLQVDDVVITGGKVTLAASMLGGKLATAPLPEIHLTGLGAGPEGITPAELTKKILAEVSAGALQVGEKLVTEVGKDALKGVENVSKGATDAAGKTLKGVTDIFKKK